MSVPPGVVTDHGPLDALLGTVAVMLVAEFTVNVAVVPLSLTAVAPVRFVPVRVTLVEPAVPLAGEKLESVGAAGGGVPPPPVPPPEPAMPPRGADIPGCERASCGPPSR